MALRTANKPGLGGALTTPVAVAATDTFQNNGQMLLHVINGSGGSINVTIKDQNSTAPDHASAFTGDVVVAVAAGVDKVIGPFPVSRFNDQSGICTVQYSATATITAELFDASR